MEFVGESVFTGGNGAPASTFDNWVPGGLTDQALWATENDYAAWNTGFTSENPPNSSHDGRLSQSLSGAEPPNKKSRNSNSTDSHQIVTNRSKAIGKMFFKTKLCCKFRAGVCPYITNCNFAHGIEELRKPPPNWQEIMAAHEGERGAAVVLEPREEHQIPIITSPDLRGESQRSSKGRHCKKFYTDEGCPYGDNCTFLHDEQSRTRESVAISVTPSASGGYSDNVNGPSQKPSNWKTRICNKWETTGYCPFGSKCHFAHGVGELHKFGEGPVELEGKDSFSASLESKPGGISGKTTDGLVPSNLLAPHSDIYHLGLTTPVQRPCLSQRSAQKWRGPNKISKVYGDWIDDIE